MIVIIDYGVGNLASVKNALDKLGAESKISSDPLVIKKAKALILPGVGAAGQGMKNLKKSGLDKVLVGEIKKGKPFLGICLGMQLLFEKSEEGNVNCLGIFKGQVKKFKKMRKIPQIGWNQVKLQVQNSKCKVQNLQGVPNNSFFYFVNSYYCLPEDKDTIIGLTDYGEEFASIVVKKNIIGVQFHPEKSGQVGFKLLENFVKGDTYVS
ncbi:imidazole glycerol phosphate synthase, glutamine amidotransferase subunit [Candidatus Daviesbacteria bacterium RIFCSPLOWO2_02_FULL_41_8]|uniref:Imidazole glycerol phosphate synthase subunit HisH n=3 Tax=Candidatus Daviesiibacteriota TaxID=1752718 RepID=A0A1F5NMG1_9BACT|nr:MAG: imidazole glycerol phosphate synthase, glutamine amidotransferase subunit [Candidatus Daviesbacteria bacterium RIFCSPHIGHO2_01_FULL_41_23]OGE32879.1 MAG: imidazole glycerol phosphate synthase, glutamine amidotransferase subunit [Candidatus Daviesbacteria bacterium RIFCSPHIGHO2_02_FULL_41_10]OGE62379.1 MAG: imidazole glycerol phosphate synthase, glutamine amidotransferase subunit [Candidatus Daviesbacteria bacterium RIFCSPLOWO2_01_FULL_41_32]OGE78550.1 MAG: imidazole glycerol phosphate sy